MTLRRHRAALGQRLLPPALRGDFRFLWASAASSNIGDGVLLAAGPLLIASITDSPLAVGLAVFAQQLPWLLFSVLSGAVVDRIDRRRLLVVVDATRTAVIAVLAVAVLVGYDPLWFFYTVLFLLGTGETLADNAFGALIATTVPRHALGEANSRLFPTFALANQLVGPPIGAFLFVASVWAPVRAGCGRGAAGDRARLPDGPPPSAGHTPSSRATRRQGVVHDVHEGLVWLWRHDGVRTLALTILLMNITFFGAFATWVLYTRDRLGLNETQFGLILAVSALGGFVGPVVYSVLHHRVGAAWLLRIGLVIETGTHLALALTRSPWVAAAVMLLFGVHGIVWGIVSTTVRQQATPAPLLGRVNSVYLLASVGGAAIGALLGSLVAEGFGLTAPFWAAFVLMIVVTAAAWRPIGHVIVERRTV